MIVDVTCAPSQIKYPRDTELLDEARAKQEQMVAVLHDPAKGRKPHMYQKIARKQHLAIARSKRNSVKKFGRRIGNNCNTFGVISVLTERL